MLVAMRRLGYTHELTEFRATANTISRTHCDPGRGVNLRSDVFKGRAHSDEMVCLWPISVLAVGRVQSHPLDADSAVPPHEPHSANSAPGRLCREAASMFRPSWPN